MRRRVFGLSDRSVEFEQRGFRGASAAMRNRLEQVGRAFLAGYHLALDCGSLQELGSRLNSVDGELRGFAFEGAAMGLALLDFLTPWRCGRVAQFLQGAGAAHAYMIHVGVGWIWARVPFGFRRRRSRLDPLLGWLAFDGWGFHEGYFQWPKYVAGQPPPGKLRGYERRVFDQGLGRSFWFVHGGNAGLIAQTMANFPAVRQADLWSGVGLAAAYAGWADEETLRDLRVLAGQFQPQLAQGAAFAAKARQRAGNVADYNQFAVQMLCDSTVAEAARVADTALESFSMSRSLGPRHGLFQYQIPHRRAVPEAGIPAAPLTAPVEVQSRKSDSCEETTEPGYEIWRQRIQKHFQTHFLPLQLLENAK